MMRARILAPRVRPAACSRRIWILYLVSIERRMLLPCCAPDVAAPSDAVLAEACRLTCRYHSGLSPETLLYFWRQEPAAIAPELWFDDLLIVPFFSKGGNA
jgi:hypothetical protein